MIVVGAKPAQHDACFVLLKDGEPLFIYEQERFNRIKHGMSCSVDVLVDGLAEYGLRPEDVDLVANAMDPSRLPERMEQVARFRSGDALEASARYLAWRLPTWRRVLEAAGFPAEKVKDYRHHLCHCAGVYHSGPSGDAAILSVDGSGETETAMIAHGHGDEIDVLRTIEHPHSLGHFYQGATHWLGWGFGEEGKTMALAAYGQPRHYEALRDGVIDYDDSGAFAFRKIGEEGVFTYSPSALAETAFAGLFGPPRGKTDPLTAHHKDVAASVQKICDEIMLGGARHAKALTGARRLLITGGVGLNSVSNGLILRSGLFDDLIVYPQANDTGTALGAAFLADRELRGERRPRKSWTMRHAYWGRRIDEENLDEAAARLGLALMRPDDIYAAAAALLAQGQIVGFVQDRAEIGPRALGHRSILANPFADGVKDKVNARVKHRELWRPFSPSVLREHAAEYFEEDADLPFMTVVATVKEAWRDKLSSIAHIDGTARVQTVTAEDNPVYHRLISAFRAKTGLGMLLNTSFNDRGEPLVQTCEQAIDLFLRSEMDALVIGGGLMTVKPEGTAIPPFSPWRHNLKKLFGPPLTLFDEGGAAFAEMLDYLKTHNRDIECSQKADPSRAAIFCVSVSADRFVFDEAVYRSPQAALSRRLIRAGMPVFWIDLLGDATRMDGLLFAHGLPGEEGANSPAGAEA